MPGYYYGTGLFGITMPLGIGAELCVFTPCAEPVRGTLSGLYLNGAVLLGCIAIPGRIGIELCGFAPREEPVSGTLLGSVERDVLGVKPLFCMTMPLGIGAELCVFTPCSEPVRGTNGASDAKEAFGEVGCVQPLIARIDSAIIARPDMCLLKVYIFNLLV